MAICLQNSTFVALTIPEILRFEVYYRESLFMEYGLEKCMENWLDIVLEAYRDLWYRIGTFSIGFL